MKEKVSLKDIAQKVGVSTALVSYVLNNQKEGRISKEVAQKIKDTARQLNYRINHIARSLKTKKTFTIGLIVSDISNSFSSSLARIIEDEANKNNYTVLFGSSDECAQKSNKLINVLLNHQVDGIILAPAQDSEEEVKYLQENEIPFVLIDRYFPGLKTNYIAIDNFKAAHAAVNHIISNGFKRIGLVGYNSSLFNLQERKRGYTTALKENGLPVKKNCIKEVEFSSSVAEVEKVVKELLSMEEPVDALLFEANKLSTIALKYFNRQGIKVPDELAIVSFDQSDATDLFYVPITHIRQPITEIGQTATKILLESMEKNNKITQINLDAELIIQQSSAKKMNREIE